MDTKKEFSFIKWDNAYNGIFYDENEILSVVKDKKIDYIITNNFYIESDRYELIYKDIEGSIMNGEQYSIYVVS